MITTDFYPRPPRGGRPGRLLSWLFASRFLSTPSARRATLETLKEQTIGELFLSTPSARRATKCASNPPPGHYNFYPRPPRGGRPARRRQLSSPGNFYPRPPRGGRLELLVDVVRDPDISIHALREEGDLSRFLEINLRADISIHALREEGDQALPRPPFPVLNFYPRPPRGGRLVTG